MYAEPPIEVKVIKATPVKMGKVKFLWWTIDVDKYFTVTKKTVLKGQVK
jgi:hypothetical protein